MEEEVKKGRRWLKYLNEQINNLRLFFSPWCNSPKWARASSLSKLHDHTQPPNSRRARSDEWSARRRELYLKAHNTHKCQTSMPPTGFEPTIPEIERPQTHALDRAATGTGK